MIDYETFCRIKDLHERQHLTVSQTARALGLDPKTVAKWVNIAQYRPRQSVLRASRLDPYKGLVVRWLDTHPYTAQQIFQRLREDGFAGGYTLIKDYVRKVRPVRREAFLKLSFAPGECAQVDWGEYGSVQVGSTRRRLSFFVMVLCYSRLMVVEFTVSQTMEHFLACHEHAFAAMHGVPARLMIDNLKSAVLQRLAGEAPVFNARYLDFSRHWGFDIAPCNVAKGNEKGRVENGVGYIKKNFLNGLDLPEFSTVNPAAQLWLDTIANVRIHGETHQRPVDLFEQERARLKPLNPMPYDTARIATVRASTQFRVALDTNHYSVPAEYAGRQVTLKAYPDRVCIYHEARLIARHHRSYDRHQDVEDPDHPKALLAQRHNAREQRLLMRFLSLSPQAQAYYEGLEQRRANARLHVRKIIALSDIYGTEAVARALEDGLAFQAFSAEYIANLLEMRSRQQPAASPLHLTRRQDLAGNKRSPHRISPFMRSRPMTTDDLLREQLLRLQLPYLREHYQALAQPAASESWSHVDYLARLIEGETHRREARSIERRVKSARFPMLKTLDQFQWNWPTQINRLQIQNLFRLAFVEDQANVILLGGVGLGKTHT